LAHASETVLPTGEMMPKPVTTTLRFDKVTPNTGDICSR
jgi:hypothetical protein